MAGEFTDVIPIPRPGRGGARANTGPKSSGDPDNPSAYDEYSKARARSESAKADLAELEFQVKSGQYVDRAAVRQAAATAYATCAQAIRSIPDNLERKLAVAPDVAQAVSDQIDAALAALSDSLAMLSGPDD